MRRPEIRADVRRELAALRERLGLPPAAPTLAETLRELRRLLRGRGRLRRRPPEGVSIHQRLLTPTVADGLSVAPTWPVPLVGNSTRSAPVAVPEPVTGAPPLMPVRLTLPVPEGVNVPVTDSACVLGST